MLVIYDLLGLDDSFKPKFLKRYADLARPIRDAVGEYIDDVQQSRFPGPEHSFSYRGKKKAARQPVKPAPEEEPRQAEEKAEAGTIPLYPGINRR